MESRDAREHIDRLQGSFRPIKIARVNADGTDVARMTAEEIAEGLRLLGAGPAPRALPVFQQVNQVNQTFNTQVFNGVPGSELHGAPPREAINPPTPRVIEGTATSLPNGFHDLPVPVRGFSDSSSELDHDFGDG
ncbi:MAG: hypothetical protein NT069_21985 [Planctomycetota bacterium]|nr:hypothetical protein [Planctomycetota bacterium]